MKFFEASNLYSLNKSTYINLRWIAYSGQLTSILVVQFLLNYNFNYLPCIGILFFSILTNLYLQFRIAGNQINNFISTIYLSFDIFQLGFLFFFTGGIANPFIFLIIVPVVFSSQYLNITSNIIQVIFVIFSLIILTFFYYDLPHPGELHFHAPDYYPWSLDIHIINYIVQVRSDGEYGSIHFEELKEIADDYCRGNLALDVFSDSFRKAYNEKCYSYIRSFVGKRNNEILRVLLHNYKSWDIYALSVIYLRLIGYIFNNKYPKTKFLAEFIQLNLINISPNPNERLTCKDTIKYINDLISKENSLRDLSKTIKSISIDSEVLSQSIEEGKDQLNARQKRIYNF